MNIIELAREVWSAGDVYIGPPEDQLERFAALVRVQALEEAAERQEWMEKRIWELETEKLNFWQR